MRVRILDAVQFDSIPAVTRNNSGLKMRRRCRKVRLLGVVLLLRCFRFWCWLLWFPEEEDPPSRFLLFDACLLDLSLPEPRSRLSRRVGTNEKFLLARMDRIKDLSSSSPSSNISTTVNQVWMDGNSKERVHAQHVVVRNVAHQINPPQACGGYLPQAHEPSPDFGSRGDQGDHSRSGSQCGVSPAGNGPSPFSEIRMSCGLASWAGSSIQA